ncbi:MULTISPECIES: rhodanese-like domain-containing protein [unclassified Anabaena]|uniref:rhodanese-like domain-containing protein n=1 Tax=unclassified Anabaena TaxID=2619674 RepID=UPI00082E9DD0|nr:MULTISPECIES: rhodanese-like domain-containing protein [unclassified Anabaena]
MSTDLVTDVEHLKLRLEWGSPGFTIVDVRDRHTYNHGHITGAIQIPLDELAQKAHTALHKGRQIYVYGDNKEQSTRAVFILRGAGFPDAVEIQGGYHAWKSIGGATEGEAA